MGKSLSFAVAVSIAVLMFSVCFTIQLWAQDEQEKKEEEKPQKLLNLTLDELVVVGTRTERKLKSLSDTVSVIPQSDIEASHAVTVDELLASVPGVNVQGAGELGEKVTLNIRGLQGRYGAQRVLVLIDGRPANEEYLGDFDFRFVPVEAIERIEVSKGPASALYGGLAIGGVINIVTKDPRKKKAGKFSASLGSHNSRRYTTVVSTGGKTLAGLFTGSGFGTDGYLKNSDGSNRDWESARFFAKVVRRMGERSVLTFATGASYGTGHEEDFKLHQVNEFQYLRIQTPLGEGSDRKLEVRVFRNGTYQERGWKLFGIEARYHQYTAGAQVQYTHKLGKHNTLTSGAEIKTQRANVGELTGHIEEQITESACYVQKEVGIGTFKFTLGVRLDSNEEFGSQVSPRAGITYEPVKDTVFRVTGGKAFRPPTISDLYMPPTLYMGMIFEGNPDLDPETLWSGEFGVRQKMRVAGKKVSIDAAVYRSRGVDFWDYMVVQFVPLTLRPLNVNAVSIFGSEVELAAILAQGLKVTLGYTYTDARYARYEPDPAIEHNHVEDIPQHTGSASLAYRSPEGHTAALVVRIAGDRYTDPQNTKANKLHSFWTLGVTGTAKLSKYTSAFARIGNLTDEKYRVVAGQVQPGRTFTIGISLSF